MGDHLGGFDFDTFTSSSYHYIHQQRSSTDTRPPETLTYSIGYLPARPYAQQMLRRWQGRQLDDSQSRIKKGFVRGPSSPGCNFPGPYHLANGECCFVLSPCIVSCNPKDANATESFKSSSPRNKESQSIPARSLSFPFALHVSATLTKSLGGEWRLSTESPRGLLPAIEQDIFVVVIVIVLLLSGQFVCSSVCSSV